LSKVPHLYASDTDLIETRKGIRGTNEHTNFNRMSTHVFAYKRRRAKNSGEPGNPKAKGNEGLREYARRKKQPR